jgi:AraC-like DNA-binding protein
MKRNELFLLFFVYYTKEELTHFLSKLSSKDFQFKRFVMGNYLSIKNVGELAEKANYSISGFIKKFHSNFGESPYQWIQKQKAKQIYVDINDRKKTLKEIASDYNFSSYQHFAKFCKTYLGSPPTATITRYNFNNRNKKN